MIFEQVLSDQGLFLSFLESSGTNFDNLVNFGRFSLFSVLLCLKHIKTPSKNICSILWCF